MKVQLIGLWTVVIPLWAAAALAQAEQPAIETLPHRKPTLADVPYGPHRLQVLDLWRADTKEITPLVFYIHGGGWTVGNKKRIVTTHGLTDYLAAGVSVVSINYRLVSDAQKAGVKPPVAWPLHDAARALQFARSKANAWGIDQQRIGVFGGSAGACTALWLAFHDEMADPASSDPVARQSTRPYCVAVAGAQTTLDPKQMRAWIPGSVYGAHAFGLAAGWGPTSFQKAIDQREQILPWIKEYSPIEWVSTDDPPVFLEYDAAPTLEGQPEKDPTHSAMFGVKLKEKLDTVGVECHLVHPGVGQTKYRTRCEFLIDKLKQPAK